MVSNKIKSRLDFRSTSTTFKMYLNIIKMYFNISSHAISEAYVTTQQKLQKMHCLKRAQMHQGKNEVRWKKPIKYFSYFHGVNIPFSGNRHTTEGNFILNNK